MFTSFMDTCKGILALDVISFMPIGCITSKSNFHYNMLGYTFVLFVIMLLMVVAYNVLKKSRSASTRSLRTRFSAL